MKTPAELNAALAGRYEIERHLGEGGMATVFLARDVRHNRRVAIKVLKPDLGAVIGPERFFAEVQVTATLQHPHLLPLFDSGEAAGALFYVMPYVEGETLRDRLDRSGPYSVDDAVKIMTAIAGAIDYAHRHGVVHRDIKPENILLHDDAPLVTDFGIALAVSNASGERLTQTGMSLGTPHYMSPEQATGDRQIDGRSDVYSLAAVLYEMLSGEPPYVASTAQGVIARVITDRPPSIRATRALVPAHIDAAILRALAKLPADRYDTATDFAAAITGERLALVQPFPATAAAVDSGFRRTLPPRSRLVVGAVWATAVIAAGFLGATLFGAPAASTAQPLMRFLVELPDTVTVPPIGRAIALSRDGGRIAVVAAGPSQTRRLFVRQITGLSADPLRGTEGAESPVYSPNGEMLLYVNQGSLMKIPSEGGEPLKIADSTDGQPTWSDRDEVVFRRGTDLWVVSANGGTARLLARPDSSRGERALSWPDVLPGGDYALVALERSAGAAPDSNHLAVVSFSDGGVSDLGIVGTAPRYADPGHVVYADGGGRMWSIPFSVRSRKATGERVLIAEQVHVDRSGAADIGVASGGSIVYSERASVPPRRVGERLALVIADSTGATKMVSADRKVFAMPRVSPDGARIAVWEMGANYRSGDIWNYELATGGLTPVTRNGTSSMPEWAPDGRRLLYADFAPFPGRFVSQPYDLSAAVTPWLTASTQSASLSVSRRGSHLAMVQFSGPSNTRQDIFIAPLASPSSLTSFVATAAGEVTPRLSPNGRWLAYSSNEAGTFQVYVLPVPGPGARVPVSIADGIEPVWSVDGRTLYYVANGRMLAARIDESRGFFVTKQDTLFTLSGTTGEFVIRPPPPTGPTLGFYDVFPNGDFVLLTRSAVTDSTRSNVIGILNWGRDQRR